MGGVGGTHFWRRGKKDEDGVMDEVFRRIGSNSTMGNKELTWAFRGYDAMFCIAETPISFCAKFEFLVFMV